MTIQSVIGALIAFSCAAVAVGTDAQTAVRALFGSRYYTFILRTWLGYVFIGGWGLIDVAFYVAFLSNKDWAKAAFNIDISENLLWTGVVVGLSAVLIIRSNFATIGSVQLGGEYPYSWSRAKLIELLNRKRTRQRRAFLTRLRPFCRNTGGYGNYFTSLESTLTTLAMGSTQRSDIEAQLSAIKASAANPNADAGARESLTGLIYDYFGPGEVDAWAQDSDYGNN